MIWRRDCTLGVYWGLVLPAGEAYLNKPHSVGKCRQEASMAVLDNISPGHWLGRKIQLHCGGGGARMS